MDEILTTRINRAKELLATIHHASLATVNQDGSPHNSPLFFALDDTLTHFCWSSYPESLHSQNIQRTRQGFVAVYDAVKSGGLFIGLKNGHATEGDELKTTLAAYNKRRLILGKTEVSPQQYMGAKQRLYRADISGLWVNYSERNEQGFVIRDYRHGIQASDLLAA